MLATDETHNACLRISEPGKATVSFPNDGSPQVLKLADTELIKSSTSVEFFWSYPVDVLTLIIETPFTEKRQPYAVSIDNESLAPSISNVYRMLENQEIEVTTTDNKLILDSDSNYQIVVKFRSTPDMNYYGVRIHYDIIPK
ncbi:unnamed protein product [Rotaria sordida]|uniref:Uncharacterized protein n=1 Tax=Rotaria sordida TaxID=392033 RepID=A0A818ZUZ7_9BILA|nr:unnamed protein product [Rotaria sordida]CAF1409894.1 unnamed protein product [Rotaria sordida]CAF3774297.1 unnamed protein product [Rotaria sordida]CAF3876945.1 unnamed protein product [Rotaria sordida]